MKPKEDKHPLILLGAWWSAPPEAKKLPSCENLAVRAGPVCPCSVYTRRPSRMSQIRKDESFDEVSA